MIWSLFMYNLSMPPLYLWSFSFSYVLHLLEKASLIFHLLSTSQRRTSFIPLSYRITISMLSKVLYGPEKHPSPTSIVECTIRTRSQAEFAPVVLTWWDKKLIEKSTFKVTFMEKKFNLFVMMRSVSNLRSMYCMRNLW